LFNNANTEAVGYPLADNQLVTSERSAECEHVSKHKHDHQIYNYRFKLLTISQNMVRAGVSAIE
jgi:hypothetical protein